MIVAWSAAWTVVFSAVLVFAPMSGGTTMTESPLPRTPLCPPAIECPGLPPSLEVWGVGVECRRVPDGPGGELRVFCRCESDPTYHPAPRPETPKKEF